MARPVKPCRKLSFRSLEDLEQELGRIEKAHAAGTLITCGNWSAGKILGHLASWIDYGFDGYPTSPPAWTLPLFRLLKGVLLKDRPMSPGMRIPGTPEGTHGIEEMDVQQGFARIGASLQRLRLHIPEKHPLFGVLTRHEWERMHLNHAALHLGFLKLD